MHSWHFSGAWKNPKRKLNSWIAALSGVCRSSGWGWGWGWGWGCRLGWRQKNKREGVPNGWQDGELSPMVELGRMQGIQWCHYLNSPLKNQSSKISIFYDVRFLFAMGWAYEFSASFYRSCLAWRSASLAGIIVHSVHPGNSSNSFPLLLQPAPVLVQWFWAATSSMLSSCLCGRGEQRRGGGEKIYENQNRTQEKRNYISFNSKSFSPAGSRAATTATSWGATSQEKDVFGSALWFGSVPAPVVVVVGRSVACLCAFPNHLS